MTPRQTTLSPMPFDIQAPANSQERWQVGPLSLTGLVERTTLASCSFYVPTGRLAILNQELVARFTPGSVLQCHAPVIVFAVDGRCDRAWEAVPDGAGAECIRQQLRCVLPAGRHVLSFEVIRPDRDRRELCLQVEAAVCWLTVPMGR